MVVEKDVKKAIVIDDDFARPTRAELQNCATPFRAFLTDNPPVKEWLDKEFGLQGDNRDPDYFEPLLEAAEKREHFWRRRNDSPVGQTLPNSVFPALVAELEAAHIPLRALRTYLESQGWNVQCLGDLPGKPEDLGDDCALLVVDYILNKGDAADYLVRSRDFVRAYVSRAKNSATGCPFVVLMSGLPQEAAKQADGFQKDIGLRGAYFRFSEKQATGLGGFEGAFEAFQRQRSELEAYRKMHERLSKVAQDASEEVKARLNALELQDLATLHAGQLIQEGEALTDYLAWLYGQVFTAHLVKDAGLAARWAQLPSDTYSVLLGHLPPTQHIPQMFAAFSLTKPATTQLHQKTKGFLQLQFGDLFAVTVKDRQAQGGIAESRTAYFMIISQTCDLLQGKIKNDQVLCAQGHGQKINGSEADLLRATMKQMNNSGNILLKSGVEYIQIEWNTKDVRTFRTDKLAFERGATYLGRLNELYALEVQHNALDELGRIGVPIQPGYSTFFRRLALKVFSAKDKEIPELAAAFDQSTIISVLRNQKDDQRRHRLLVSNEVRKWLLERVSALVDHAALPGGLKADATKFRDYMAANSDWRLLVREKLGQAKVTREIAGGGTESMESKVTVVFAGVFDPGQMSDVRLEITLHTDDGLAVST